MRGALLGVVLAVLAGGCATPYAGAPTYRPAALDRPAAAATGRGPAAPAPPPTATAAPEPLSLEQCIRTALETNRRIDLADRRVLVARDQVLESYAPVLPRVVASGQYSARDSDPEATFGGLTVQTGDASVYSFRVSALVPIYDFRSWHAIAAARGRAEAAELDASRARQDLAFAVTVAYFRILEAEKIRTVVQESIAVVERQLAIARDFLAQGLVARNEVLTVEVQLAERREQLIRADDNIEIAKAALNRVMGVDVTRPVAVADVLEVEPYVGTFEHALRSAIERRPDLASLKRQIEIARDEYRAALGGFAPRLYGFGEYDHVPDSFLIHHDWLQGGVAFEFPLFEGGSTYARLKQAKERIAQAVDFHDDRVDDIVLDVKQAYLRLRDAAERIPVARKSIEQAEENLRIVRDQYGQGLLTSADVLLEEDRLSRARSNYFQALYDYHDAVAGLEYATGEAPPR